MRDSIASTYISLVAATALCTSIIIFFALSVPDLIHWFLFPTLFAGIIITKDLIDWLRNEVDYFDPVGVLGILGFHFFFLAPLLHVYWNSWLEIPHPPEDWRSALGFLGVINSTGLVLYNISRKYFVFKFRNLAKPPRVINSKTFGKVLFLLLALSFILQFFVYQAYGGIAGYITAYENRYETSSFAGMGWVFMLSEAFPKLAIIWYAVFSQNRKKLRSWHYIVIALFVYLLLSLLFGGLRGSRSNTVWNLFFAAGIIHLWIRPLNKKIITMGLAFVVLFLSVYGLYKTGGVEGLYNRDINNNERSTLKRVLLGDLARSDIQALLIERIAELPESARLPLAYGRTYVSAAALLVPRSIWLSRPEGKVKEGTIIQYGETQYQVGNISSRVYGLVGEFIINFGPYLSPVVFLILALFVSLARVLLYSLKDRDPRLFLLPILVNLCFVVLASDLDNVVFFFIKNCFLVFLLVYLGSKRLVAE